MVSKYFIKNMYIIGSFILILFFLFRYIFINSNISVIEVKAGCLYLSIVYIISEAVWLRTTHRGFSPFSLFLIACFLFNSGQLILYLFDIEISNWFVITQYYNREIMYRMICFQSMCVLAMTSGALIAYNKKTEKIFRKKIYTKKCSSRIRYVDKIDLFFLFLSVAMVFSYLNSLIIRSNMSYTDYYYSTSSASWFSFIRYLFHIIFYYELIRTPKGGKKKCLLFIGISISLLMVLIGSRFNIITIIGGIIFILYYINRDSLNIKNWKKIVLVIFILVVLSMMRGLTYLRNYSLNSINWKLISEVYSDGLLNGLYGTLSECGKSANCLLSTIQEFLNGRVEHAATIPYSILLGFVPLKLVSFFNFSVTNLSLSDWVTSLIGTSNGQGYSIFAESFYNLGIYGFVIMFLVGYMFILLERMAISFLSSHLFLKKILGCAIIYLITYSIFLSRAETILVSTSIRRCFYLWLIVKVFYLR